VKIVLDTNVFVSGVFFTGPPGRILDAWRDGRVKVAVSAAILEEYHRVGSVLAERYEGVALEPLLTLLAVNAEVVEAPELSERVCEDPDDDKFLACALAAGSGVVVSGDKHLIRVSGWSGIEVLRPRQFCEQYLASRPKPGG
jgi:putative PIN family toxin of toxin-antitoxin system